MSWDIDKRTDTAGSTTDRIPTKVYSGRMSGERHASWLVFLIEKTAQFLFLLSCLCLALYILGNFQLFLDSSQIMLLRIVVFTSFFCALLSLYGVVFYFFSGLKWGRIRLAKLLLYTGLFIVSAGVQVLLRFFTAWFQL